MKIAVLGGGHGCYAAAADLSDAGHEVRLWRRDADALQPVIDTGHIVLKDQDGSREVKVQLASANIAKVVGGAELIIVPSPAVAQADIAKKLATCLEDGQVVFLAPGTFGGYIMHTIVREEGCFADVAWAETGTLPYLARKHGEREVNITIRAIHLPTGVFPLSKMDSAIEIIRRAYPAVHDCGDILSGALMNAGPIIHPPLMVMNAAPLQHFDEWDIHNEGTQKAVRDVTDKLDQERMDVRKAFGYGAPHYPLADHYNTDRWMYGDAHKKLTDSGDWREHINLYSHRYITEDTVLGLSFLASAARYVGVKAPVAHGILAIVGSFLDRDLYQGPRTFEELGLARLTPDELAAKLG